MMPLHDWTRVPAGLFHHFHQDWSIEIARELNRGRLPTGCSALVEQRANRVEPDVLAIEAEEPAPAQLDASSPIMTVERPQTQFVVRSTNEVYSSRANRIVVRHHLGRIVAVIEILSPGNKHSRRAVREFVDKTVEFLRAGVHVLIIDPFPPTVRDPRGIHKEIWDEFDEREFELPLVKDRILASYQAGVVQTAFVEPVAVGQILPDMPLFLFGDHHIMVPLETTYDAAWAAAPSELRKAVESGVIPFAEIPNGDDT